MLSKKLVLLATVICLTACAEMNLREDHGKSVAQNADVQTVNKVTPAREPAHTLDGQKAENIMERYRQEEAESSTSNLVNEISDD
ncbi:MAG: hypothetical protein KAG18_00825 [Sinobacterium sp.]|nr:hypothetical protein [Sinobacterium sp.]